MAQLDATDVSGVSNAREIVTYFLSCKSEDAGAAREIANQLQFLGNQRLNVLTPDVVPYGGEYRPKTLQGIARADKLILLYTDPHLDWDSCLYESGFFDGKQFPDGNMRLFVLHDDSIEVRAPLAGFKTVKVSATQRNSVQEFLREVYVSPPRSGVDPLCPDLFEDSFEPHRRVLEDAIITAVSGPHETRVFAKEIQLIVTEDALWQCREKCEVPDETRVIADEESFRLFSLRRSEQGYSWSEFYSGMDRVSEHTSEWAKALAKLMQDIATSTIDISSPGLPLYRSSDARVYRPAVRSFRRKKGILSFRVLFTDLPPETTTEPPGAATSLAQALTVARMMRWGVLTTLQDEVRSLNKKRLNDDIQENRWFECMSDAIDRFLGQKLTVLVEAFNRGYQRDDLKGYFPEGPRHTLDEILAEWDLLCESAKDLSHSFEQRSGQPEVLMSTLIEMIENALNLNKQLMLLCAKRYAEVIEAF